MAYNGLSSAHYTAHRYQEALDGYERALVLAREAGNLVTEGNLLNNIAQCHFTLGDPAAALAPQRAAVDVFREVGDMGFVGLALANLAELEHATGAYAPAETHARDAIALAETNDQALTEAFGREVLARVRRDLGDTATARAELTLAIDLYDQVRSPLAESARAARKSLPTDV
ncbi:tetratricopeptide repeat protein [Actinokineospora soli]|uniref:Tetratricopeptide repeat protein n=1 Tax=Actinokineospora soli TaxID=1048753 RepID=A0ABW2TIJ5_9PSEU